MLCGLLFPSHFPSCFAGHTFHDAFHNVFHNAFHYVKLRYVRNDSVLRCIMLVRNAMWVTLCGWRYASHGVGHGVGDDVWLTLCRWRYARHGVGHGVGYAIWVTICGSWWVTICGWRNVADGMWVTAWVTMCVLHYVACGVRGLCVCAWVTTQVKLCGWWCDGDDVYITLRGKHYVAEAVQMTLSGSWCVSIHTRVKTQFRSK